MDDYGVELVWYLKKVKLFVNVVEFKFYQK